MKTSSQNSTVYLLYDSLQNILNAASVRTLRSVCTIYFTTSSPVLAVMKNFFTKQFSWVGRYVSLEQNVDPELWSGRRILSCVSIGVFQFCKKVFNCKRA
ncbi:Hypothetical_protein [Hexamita inflata]|uniref:Hypothetical_protein n=1 Tax=Hexamita inflata TaxID=28002 RepID=A0AA86UKM8_9EUKA|nr:Hypothetical protein HINF_LOCUS42856 [Hexamita inflata]